MDQPMGLGLEFKCRFIKIVTLNHPPNGTKSEAARAACRPLFYRPDPFGCFGSLTAPLILAGCGPEL